MTTRLPRKGFVTRTRALGARSFGRRLSPLWVTSALLPLAFGCAGVRTGGGPAEPSADQLPRFTSDGELVRPVGWEEWVLVGASTGLSYSEPRGGGSATSPGRFHNVHMQPWAYRYTMENGAFPDGAMLILSFYSASQKASPALSGFYEGDRVGGVEVHVKWAGVDPTGWAFYNFRNESTATSAKVRGDASCYSCHAEEGAFDHVFVQFYPTLRSRLLARPDSLAESAVTGP